MKYRSKPKVVEALQFNEFRIEEMENFAGHNFKFSKPLFEMIYTIRTNHGTAVIEDGDFVIKYNGEFYPVREDIFLESYEAVE